MNTVLIIDYTTRLARDEVSANHLPGVPARSPILQSVRGFALRQMEQEFPLAVEQGLVALWSTLEDYADRFITDMVLCWPNKLDFRALNKVKIRAGDYLPLDTEGRAQMLVREVDRVLAESIPAGIERILALLRIVGLDFNIDKSLRQGLVELYQLRCLFVHRGGVVDGGFLRSCPWRSETVGQRVAVGRSAFADYAVSVSLFTQAVLERYVSHLEEHREATGDDETRGPTPRGDRPTDDCQQTAD